MISKMSLMKEAAPEVDIVSVTGAEISYEDAKRRAELLDHLEAAFVGEKIAESNFDDQEEEILIREYSSSVDFTENGQAYRLKYSFGVNDDGAISSIYWPICEMLVDGEYHLCPAGEVSAKRIYEILYDVLESWL